MGQNKFIFVFFGLLSFCSCEISYEEKTKLLNGFISFYNSLPNQIYTCDDGYLRNAQQSTEQNSYEVEVILKVSDLHNLESTKYLRCTGKLADLADDGVSMLNHRCEETTLDNKGKEIEEPAVTETNSEAGETPFVRKPIQLDNEIQTNTAVTSGEQFIAIPREDQKVHCIGCSSHVNPQAPGVSELAAIGVRQLNSLEPNTLHTLNSVVEVERQVQVVNGIRYILTLIVDYNNCETPETETCLDSKTCKVTVLEKPWVKLPDGSKYRAILSNNCTEQWQFGDNGVIIPQTPVDDRETNNINTPQTDGLDIIKPVTNVEVQALPHTEKTLTNDDIKAIQQQIIPNKHEHLNEPVLTVTESTKTSEDTESKEHVIKVESAIESSPNAIPAANPYKTESLSEDKRRAIDDMLNFFDFDVRLPEDKIRQKRDQQFVGGASNKDVKSPEITELAKDALRQYLRDSVYNRHFDIIEILNATVQVVAGYVTRLEFKISPTTCLIDKEGNPSSSECKIIDYNDVTICTSRIWEKPWLKFKEINTTCEIDNKNTRSKRHLPGGAIVNDPNDPEFMKLAMESMKQYLKNNGITHNHTVMSIDTVTTQVVAGKRIQIDFKISPVDKTKGDVISCHSEIWEKSWENFKQITVNCGIDNHSRARREVLNSQQSSIRRNKGGQQDQDPTKIEYKDLAQVTLNKYLKLQKNSNLHNVVEVKKVTTQVVSGIKYKIEYIAAPKSCADDISTCVDKTSVLHCAAEVWEQLWLGKKDIQVSCKSKKKTRHSTIKDIEETIRDEERKNKRRKKRSMSQNHSNSTADALIIQNLVQESLNKLEMSSSNRYKQRVLQINSYSTKITSGKVTTIDFDVAYTSCLKYELVDDVKTCKLLEHLPKRHCVSQVWERLWIENGRSIEVTCADKTPLGAHVEIESSETAIQLANEALKHIEAKYPHPLKQKIVRIFSLEKQVVAGIHYRMKVEVGSTHCPALSAETSCELDTDVGSNKFCRVNIWLQPWTDHAPNFRVSCDYHENVTAELYHQIQAEHLFHNFLTTYKPAYIGNNNEMKRKFEVFKANIRKINELNTHERGTATYGVTRFADLSYDEFTQRFLGLKPSLRGTNLVPMRQAEIPSVSVPDKFDWRDHGAVTEVKNQGSCGSCWAFSVTGNIEGQWKMKSGQLVSLSEQELVDCDKLDQGCNGGLPDNAYRAIEQLGGLELETDYPYDGEDDKCSFNKTIARVQISSAVNITTNETGMLKWLVKNGPISIGINANAMQFYMGGVSHPWKMLCNPSNLDHGVLIVGYGIKDYPLFHKRLPFWTIKNSWGPEWGEQGYYRVFRGDGTCGVNQMASSAVV